MMHHGLRNQVKIMAIRHPRIKIWQFGRPGVGRRGYKKANSMKATKPAAKNDQSIGMAIWQLKGRRLVDRVGWLFKNGFGGVSLLQSVMDEVELAERREAAAAIVEHGMWVTYHANVHHKLTASQQLDMSFVTRLMDNVIWWHENAGGVWSSCCDPIHLTSGDGRRVFDQATNRRYIEHMSGRLTKYGIRIGIENSCGGDGMFCTLDDIRRFKEYCADIKMGMLLDVGHVNIHVRSDNNGKEHDGKVEHFISELPLEIHEVHFSDNFGLKDEHKFLGYGNLDVPAALKAVKSRGFDGKLTLEVCFDFLAHRGPADIDNPEEIKGLLISREKVLSAWAAC